MHGCNFCLVLRPFPAPVFDHFCILQAIKNWSRGMPRNEASCNSRSRHVKPGSSTIENGLGIKHYHLSSQSLADESFVHKDCHIRTRSLASSNNICMKTKGWVSWEGNMQA